MRGKCLSQLVCLILAHGKRSRVKQREKERQGKGGRVHIKMENKMRKSIIKE